MAAPKAKSRAKARAKVPGPAHHEIRFLSGGKPVKDLAPIAVWPAELHPRRGGVTLSRALQIVRGPADPVVSVDAVQLTGLGVNSGPTDGQGGR